MDPRWNYHLRDVIQAIIEDYTMFSNDPEPCVINSLEVANKIIDQIELRDYSIKVTKGRFPKDEDEYFALDSKVKDHFND